MKLRPQSVLSDLDVRSGMKRVIHDGLATEAMTTLTGGTFLVAIALYLGANNIQIGLLASLPAITNVFQLGAIWLVQRYKNRRAIAVVSSFLARLPLLVIGFLPFLFDSATSINTLIFLLTFHYFFGSLSGPGWNSWMKDLIPHKELGSYFSHRSRLMQILNVTLSLVLALLIDYVKPRYPQYEVMLYSGMFVMGGVLGLVGVYILSRTPEPAIAITNDHIFSMVRKPFKNVNFRKLLTFQVAWAFALNIATPFYAVYILSSIGLPLTYLIGFNLLTQLASIVSIKMWGRYSDVYSNKTVLHICAPVYACCILSWPLISLYASPYWFVPVLTIIHLFTGFATSGINISLSNIGLKMAPRQEAIAYIVARSMTLAGFAALAPIVGGILANYFSDKSLSYDLSLGAFHIPLINLEQWSFLFIIGALLGLLSLRLLKAVDEDGEVRREVVVPVLKKDISASFIVSSMKMLIFKPALLYPYIRKKIRKMI